MLKFTKAQEAALIANRRGFNENERQLASRLHGNTMLGNASPLPKDVWGEWDREGIEVQRQTLAVFNDLAASGSRPIPIGKLASHFQTISDSGEAQISLDGRAAGVTDQPVIAYHATPIPVMKSEFSYGWRQIAAAESDGFFDLDLGARRNAMFKVAEKLESVALDGDASIVVGGAQLYGLRTHPQRNTRTTGVALNGATGAQWLAEVAATLQLLRDANFKRPATLYLNSDDWFYAQWTEFTSGYPKTVAQRVQEMAGVASIVPADNVLASQIIAVVKDPMVVQVLNAMPMSNQAMFRANPHDDYKFQVMAAAAVQVKFDAENNCGVAVSSI